MVSIYSWTSPERGSNIWSIFHEINSMECVSEIDWFQQWLLISKVSAMNIQLIEVPNAYTVNAVHPLALNSTYAKPIAMNSNEFDFVPLWCASEPLGIAEWCRILIWNWRDWVESERKQRRSFSVWKMQKKNQFRQNGKTTFVVNVNNLCNFNLKWKWRWCRTAVAWWNGMDRHREADFRRILLMKIAKSNSTVRICFIFIASRDDWTL